MSIEHPESSSPGTDQQDGAASASERVVQAGDCFHSIADATGHAWKTMWSANNEIHESRKSNQLVPGDSVHVPRVEQKYIDKPAGNRHTFLKKGTLVRLRLRLVRGGKPIVNEAYLLRVGLKSFQGSTDGAGVIDNLIPAAAATAILEVPRFSLESRIRIGVLPPAGTMVGIQARLRNLGYGCDLTGEDDDGTSAALKCFQEDRRLEASGNPDPKTKSALVREHGI